MYFRIFGVNQMAWLTQSKLLEGECEDSHLRENRGGSRFSTCLHAVLVLIRFSVAYKPQRTREEGRG